MYYIAVLYDLTGVTIYNVPQILMDKINARYPTVHAYDVAQVLYDDCTKDDEEAKKLWDELEACKELPIHSKAQKY